MSNKFLKNISGQNPISKTCKIFLFLNKAILINSTTYLLRDNDLFLPAPLRKLDFLLGLPLGLKPRSRIPLS